MENKDPVWLEFQEIVREVCTAISLACPRCKNQIRADRIKLIEFREDVQLWLIMVLCESCNEGRHMNVELTKQEVRRAVQFVCGDRSVREEARLRTSGAIPPNYEMELPEVLGSVWVVGPKEQPQSPTAPV